MNQPVLTREEQKTYNILLEKSGLITSRDEIAQAVWGERWLAKYSDWQIDRLIYLLRHKLPDGQKIKTLRNSGYVFEKDGVTIPKIKSQKVTCVSPTNSYLEYMNNPKSVRKILKDLFNSFNQKMNADKVLVVNSYSVDNIDAAVNYFGIETQIYFSNFDNRALKIHTERVEKMGFSKVHVNYDDIRNSGFKDNFFDCIINDFRLNFNLNDKQNIQTVDEMKRILAPNGKILVSVVVDARYEFPRFGSDQEKAPTNKDKPWTFAADEGLTRKCFTVPYYKRLFENSGFKILEEFDIEEGKKWFSKFKHYKETHQPAYRRFLLVKARSASSIII